MSPLAHSQPVLVLSHSPWKNVAKSKPSQRTGMPRLVMEAIVDYTLVQFSNIFTEYLL